MARGMMMVIIAAVVAVVLAGGAIVEATVAEILKDNGLPAGLLPATVKSYTLSENGKFQVKLMSECYAKIQEDVYYAETITGELTYGKIKNLNGIQALEGWFWLKVTGIVASSDSISFQVGIVSKSLDINLFSEPPQCKRKATGMSFSDWMSQALNGDLKVNVASTVEESLPRKMLQ